MSRLTTHLNKTKRTGLYRCTVQEEMFNHLECRHLAKEGTVCSSCIAAQSPFLDQTINLLEEEQEVSNEQNTR